MGNTIHPGLSTPAISEIQNSNTREKPSADSIAKLDGELSGDQQEGVELAVTMFGISSLMGSLRATTQVAAEIKDIDMAAEPDWMAEVENEGDSVV